MGQNGIISSIFAPQKNKKTKKNLGQRPKPWQELEVGPCSRPYLLVLRKSQTTPRYIQSTSHDYKQKVFPQSKNQVNLGQTMEKPQELSRKSLPQGAPQGKSYYSRDLPWANFQTIPYAFPLLVRLQASKTEWNVSLRRCLKIFRAVKIVRTKKGDFLLEVTPQTPPPPPKVYKSPK